MEIKYQHDKTVEESYAIVSELLPQLQAQYSDLISGVSTKWNSSNDKMDFNFKASKLDIKGNIELDDHQLILQGKVPLLARAFQRKIESAIKGKLEEIL